MLLLVNTTDKIQLTTSSTATVDVHVSYMDHTLSTDNIEGGRQLTAISSATTTDICAAPSSGVTRNVKTIHIRNRHASTSCDVTVIYDANGTDYELRKETLRAGEELDYVDGVGFFLAATETNPAVRVKVLTGDQSNSTTTPTNVAGLDVTTGVGTFIFQYYCLLQSAATTTGHKLSVNHTGTVTTFTAHLLWQSGVSASSDDVVDQDFVAAGAGVLSGFAARAKSVAGWGATTDVDTANADVLYLIHGLVTVSVDGDIELWHGSDAAAASTVKAGSSLVLIRTD